MNFFAYGCSFTYGSELADQDFCKKTQEETDRIKNKIGHQSFYKTYVGYKHDEGYKNLMHERSYAHTIAKKLGKDTYINRAVPGGSNMHIFYNILEDIENGKVTTDDIIFVGFTSFSRYVWHDASMSKFRSTTVEGGSWPSQKFKKQYTLNVSDYDYILQNIQSFYAIKEITKNFKFFYQTTQWPYTHTYGNMDNSALFSSLKDIDNNALIPATCLFYEMPNCTDWKKYSHAFGHPFHKYHVSFGNKLGDAILEKI